MIGSVFGFIKKLLLVVLCLAALLVGGLFAFENPQKISPIVNGYALPSLSLGLYLCFILFFGVLIGLALSVWGSQSKQIKLKVENRRLKKEAKKKREDQSGKNTKDLAAAE